MTDDEKIIEHPNAMVGAVKKPTAAIASQWFRRNANDRLAGSGFLGARRIQRKTVVSDTPKPRMRSSR
jgi:hypothetical protein